MSSQNNNGATTDHAFGMRQFLGSLRTLLSWITWILPFIFVFVKFNVPELINNSDPSLIMQFTIASWYLSWVFGLNIDIQMQESVYMYDPHQGEVPKFIYINFMALLICALLLLFFVNDTKYFSIILTIFSVVSIFGFWFYGKITNSIHKFNYSEYVQDKDKLHQFQSLLMNEYLRGKWTYYRAASLVFLLVPMDIICLYPDVASQVGIFINQRFSTVSQKSINDLIPVLSIIVFLVFAESWQWKKRIESNISINLLKNIISSI